MEGILFGMLFWVVLVIAIWVAIARWVFRVNHIVSRLDRILAVLDPEEFKRAEEWRARGLEALQGGKK